MIEDDLDRIQILASYELTDGELALLTAVDSQVRSILFGREIDLDSKNLTKLRFVKDVVKGGKSFFDLVKLEREKKFPKED
jgi:hypothetical protein